jgi:hypothetical protein
MLDTNILKEIAEKSSVSIKEVLNQVVSNLENVELSLEKEEELAKIESDLTSENINEDILIEQLNKFNDFIKEEVAAQNKKNVEQDKKMESLKQNIDSNKKYTSNMVKNLKGDIEDLYEVHNGKIDRLTKRCIEVEKELSQDHMRNNAAILELSNIVEGLLREDEELSDRMNVTLSVLNKKIDLLKKAQHTDRLFTAISIILVAILAIIL